MKILILYYSGAGNTKFVAGIINKKLIENDHTVNIKKITEKNIDNLNDDFDVLYVGFPIYFRDAPELVYKIFEKLNGKGRPLMIFITKGLYSGNAYKNIYEYSIKNNFIPIAVIELLMPGTDLLTFSIKSNSFLEKFFLSIHSRNINKKIDVFINSMIFHKQLKKVNNKWYTFFDNLIIRKIELKLGNDHKDWIKKFFVDEKKCIQCMRCVKGVH